MNCVLLTLPSLILHKNNTLTHQALLKFNGSSGYQGDVALDALKLICLDGNPGPFTNGTAGPFTNGTAAPHPTGNGEVRVKFGGAKVTIVPFSYSKFAFLNCFIYF